MRYGVCLLGVFLGLAAGEGGEGAARADRTAMQGDWAGVSMVVDGQKFPNDDAQALFRTIEGDRYTVSRYDRVIGRGTFVLDASHRPGWIDAQPAGGKSPLLRGIYRLEGGTLTFCFAQPGKERPVTFTSEPGSGHSLSAWQREKAR